MDHRDALTRQIWVGMLDTERAIRYCDKLADKSLRRHRFLSVSLVAASVGVAAPLLEPIPAYVAAIFLAIVAITAIGSLVTDYATKAVVCRVVCVQYRELSEEWRQLWYGEPSQADVNALREKYNRISNNYYDFPSDDALNEKAKDEAYKTLPSEFT